MTRHVSLHGTRGPLGLLQGAPISADHSQGRPPLSFQHILGRSHCIPPRSGPPLTATVEGGQHPELSFVEKKPRLRVASHALLQNQPEGSGTFCCVESEFPLDKRVGLFSLSIRKVVQVSSFSQETAQGQRCAWRDHPQTPRLQGFGPDSWAFQKQHTAPVICFCS